MSLLTVAQFKIASTMPDEDVDELETRYPGFVAKRIALREGRMNSRLAKRYQVPFDPASPPDTAYDWIVAQVTLDCYLKRGFNPSAAQDALVEKEATTAAAEILEAADAVDGKWELPLRQDNPGSSAVVKGGPFGSSENNPYAAFDAQADDIRGGGWS